MKAQKDFPIVVVGTTSSGKSTLMNLLSGRFLLTPKVQESPRIRVELRHRSYPRNVTIYDPLQPHGLPIQAHTDAAARHALRNLIQRLDGLPEGRRLTVPIRVDLPVRLAPLPVNLPKWLADLAGLLPWLGKLPPRIPTNRRVVLRDLPGYLNCGNQELQQIISSGLNDALVLFVINAGEVDHRKEDELIRMVFQHLRQRGQPWHHVFFVLNRIDVFGDDPDHKDEKQKRISDLRYRFAAAAQQEYELPERPSPPTIHQIATLPALAGQLLSVVGGQVSKDDRDYLLEIAIDYAGRMMPPKIADRLPRSRQRWHARHVRTFCHHAATASHWNDFRLALCRHVQETAPPLLYDHH